MPSQSKRMPNDTYPAVSSGKAKSDLLTDLYVIEPESKHQVQIFAAAAFLLLHFVLGCSADTASAYATELSTQRSSVPSDLNQSVHGIGTDLSQALANNKPTLILFTPVEMCQIRYCLQPSLVRERLAQAYPDQINFVEAPVYAVDAPGKPSFPVVDLGVYLVEPYAHWVPEMVQTQFGWGIDAPSVVLVDQNSVILVRGGEFFDVEGEEIRMLKE